MLRYYSVRDWGLYSVLRWLFAVGSLRGDGFVAKRDIDLWEDHTVFH